MRWRCGPANRLALALALGSACAPSFELEIEPGEDLVLVGIIDPNGGERSPRFELGRVRGELPLVLGDLREGDLVGVWRFRPGYFVDPGGRALEGDELTDVAVRAITQPRVEGYGACGRCPAPAYESSTQIVHPGASCAPGRAPGRATFEIARGAASEVEVERLFDGLRFEWPGECACDEARVAPPPLTLAPIAPGAPTWPHGAVVDAADGRVVLLDPAHAVSIAPDGTITRATPELEGAIVAAIAGSGSEIYVATYRAMIEGTSWWATDSRLSRWSRTVDVSNTFTPAVGAPNPEEAGAFAVAGQTRVNTVRPTIQSCGPSGAGRVQCAEIAGGLPTIDPNERFEFIRRVADGSWIAAGGTGTYVQLSGVGSASRVGAIQLGAYNFGEGYGWIDGRTELDGAPALRWRLSRLDDVRPPGASLRPIQRVIASAVVGQALYSCVHGQDREAMLVRRVLDREELFGPERARTSAGFEVIACRHQSSCTQVIQTGTIAEVSIGAERLRFDERGLLGPEELANRSCAERPPVSSTERARPPFARLQQWRAERWIGLLPGGVAVLGRAGELEQDVYGERLRPEWYAFANDRRDGVVWAVGAAVTGGVLARIDGTMRLEPAAGLPPMRAFAIDHAAPALTLVGAALDGRLARARIAGGVAEVEYIDLGEQQRSISGALIPTPHAVTEVAPGVHVVAVSPRGLWRVEGLEATPIRIDDDDPATADREAATAEDELCMFVNRNIDYGIPEVRRGNELRALSSSQGVGWAVGCRASMFRVNAFGPEPMAARVAAERLGDGGALINPEDNRAAILSVGARCADRATVAARPFTSSIFLAATIVELRPSGRGDERDREARDLTLSLADVAPSIGFESDLGDVHSILVERAPFTYVLSGAAVQGVPGAIARADGEDIYLGAPILATAEGRDGRQYYALAGGEVLATAP